MIMHKIGRLHINSEITMGWFISLGMGLGRTCDGVGLLMVGLGPVLISVELTGGDW